MQIDDPNTLFPAADITPEQMARYLDEGRRQRGEVATAMARAAWRCLRRRRGASTTPAPCMVGMTPQQRAGRST